MRKRGTGAADVVARVIYLIAAAVAGLIVIGIILVVLDANPNNGIVSFFTDVAEGLVGPFKEMFDLDDREAQIAVNWGIAAFVYFVVGALIAGLIGRLTSRRSSE